MIRAITLISILSLLSACSSLNREGANATLSRLAPLTSEVVVPNGMLRVNSVLVAPISFSEQSRGLRARAAVFYQDLCTAASESLDISHSCSPTVFKRFDRSSGVPKLSELISYARGAGLDGVFTLAIEKFIQRDGSSYAAQSPAEVSLSMSLVRSSDSLVVWSATYYLKDESLMDNLLELDRKVAGNKEPRWQSAPEIFGKAARDSFVDLSAQRLAQFSVRDHEANSSRQLAK